MNEDVRQAALQQLLADAEKRGDRGASSAGMASILNGVDIGRSGRAEQAWADRLSASQSSGQTMLNAYASALAAQRAKAARGGGRRSGGGGGGLTPTYYGASSPANNSGWSWTVAAPTPLPQRPATPTPATYRPSRTPVRYS